MSNALNKQLLAVLFTYDSYYTYLNLLVISTEKVVLCKCKQLCNLNNDKN